MGKPKKKTVAIEPLEAEEEEAGDSPVSYNILTYPADYPLEVLVKKLKKREIVIPKFQRGYVWKPTQASKLIESFLLGLPVPPIFLYTGRGNGKLLVVDGQQRLRTTRYFFDGKFGKNHSGVRPPFALTGLNPKSTFAGKTFADLLPADAERLKGTVLRAFIVKQLDPGDDASIYHIFERLNTGGTLLQGQEIRNCVFPGVLNNLLHALNKLDAWRKIFGKAQRDKRQRDNELILRFFALHFNIKKYTKPMKLFLNNFMSAKKEIGSNAEKEWRDLFTEVSEGVLAHLGAKPFHIRSGLNAAVCDSVLLAFATNIESEVPSDIKKRFKELIGNQEYKAAVSSSTTDVEVIRARVRIANDTLFG